MKQPEAKRIAILELSPGIISSLFIQGRELRYEVIKDGLPNDAKIINTRLSMAGDIELLIESNTFPLVKYGEIPPKLKTPIVKIKL